MIDKAKELAEQAGVIGRITFVKGALEDLSDYTNKSYDMDKMMLLTGSKKESTLDFYRKAGYNNDDKTAFIQWI